jgi:type IV pilus assembly protein PilB
MPRKKIGDLLKEKGFITESQLKEALEEQATSGTRLGEVLVRQGLITEEQLVETISERLGIPTITISSMVIDPKVIRRVPVEVARRYNIIPAFAIGDTLTLAMSDPLNIIAIEQIKYLTGADVKRAVASKSEIDKAIDQYYSVADSLNEIVAGHRRESSAAPAPVVGKPTEVESPIVKMVNVIVTKAVRDRASDIHIEPDETSMRIRYRINGVMREEAAPPKSMQSEVVTRIKVAADLDVSEKRLPQDGRFMVTVDDATIDLRISTLPTIHGEKIVIRILDRRNLFLSFSQLGFEAEIEAAWQSVIRKPEGLILICGPTSSGKTSTLYATLGEVNSVEKNIITIEDPVEYSLPLINQIQINEKAGLTFPSSMRSIVRQNPDIIMVGEIRDRETAQMAIRAALTGHLVFSTVHTNSAPAAVTRLVDMGIEPYLVAASLKGVLAQRLLRVNCPECLQSYQPSETILGRAGLTGLVEHFDFRRGEGCTKCRDTGFGSLTGLFEFFGIDNRIAELILTGSSLEKLCKQARNSGYVPLFEAGLHKVREGLICLEELLKETSSIEDDSVAGEPTEAENIDARTV